MKYDREFSVSQIKKRALAVSSSCVVKTGEQVGFTIQVGLRWVMHLNQLHGVAWRIIRN